MVRWIIALFDALLPRHAVAKRARAVTEEELGELMRPHTLTNKKWIHALWAYHDARVRAAIKAVKYYGETEVAERLGTLAADYLLELIEEKQSLGGWQDIVVVPIPSSKKRLRRRGYNQVELVASAILKRLDGVHYLPTVLAREERESQVHVARSLRRDNIKGAFRVQDAGAIQGRFIILIDDVVESGSTLTDAKRALLEAGAKDVLALALAH